MAAAQPPSKKEQLYKLLERGSVFVHLDPRRDGVVVPPWLATKPQLVLQLGLNFPIPIRDLEINDDGVRCTLSFNRSPFYCIMPWTAVYGLVGDDGQVTVWPSELPHDLPGVHAAPEPDGGRATRRDAPRERRGRGSSSAAAVLPPSTPPPPARPRFSLVKSPVDEASAGADAGASETADKPAERPAARRPEVVRTAGDLDRMSDGASDEREAATTASDERDPASRDAGDASAEPAAPSAPAQRPSARERAPFLRLVK